MSFHRRLAKATIHEDYVLELFTARGWVAEKFGQGQLSDEIRGYLRCVDTSVRWLPDIIAAKQFAARVLVVFVDAKAGSRYIDTGNHDIEVAALESAERWIEFSGNDCRHYFVFSDGGVITAPDVRAICWVGPYRGNGSGTPFVLFPVTACQTFDAVFGDPNA